MQFNRLLGMFFLIFCISVKSAENDLRGQSSQAIIDLVQQEIEYRNYIELQALKRRNAVREQISNNLVKIVTALEQEYCSKMFDCFPSISANNQHSALKTMYSTLYIHWKNNTFVGEQRSECLLVLDFFRKLDRVEQNNLESINFSLYVMYMIKLYSGAKLLEHFYNAQKTILEEVECSWCLLRNDEVNERQSIEVQMNQEKAQISALYNKIDSDYESNVAQYDGDISREEYNAVIYEVRAIRHNDVSKKESALLKT
ncbi:hypothetical protein KAZ82_00020 [Candidatus Babeliales bacterium]|nr:hypothetical protein [Candidatus Babeliales bacterium]